MKYSNFYSQQEAGINRLINLSDQNIAILGFGIEGQSAARYLFDKCRKVVIFDEKERGEMDESSIKELEEQGVEFRLGKIDGLSTFDVIVRSPGFHPDEPAIEKAKNSGKKVTSVTKMFFDLSPTKNIIGVTGTKGKGTTSTLIYKMLLEDGRDAYLGGNIGESPLSFIDKLNPDSWVILEMSSFQLQDLHKSPHIAVQLMTTREHLDYHKDLNEYINAKRNIFRYQKDDDFAIVNQDYPASNESDIEGEGETYKVSREREVIGKGCFVKGDSIVEKLQDQEIEVIKVDRIALPGRHNLENVCAAVMAALLSGVKLTSIQKVLASFKGLEHRIEEVATVRGVKYYDDSFSTTPETAIAAIEAFEAPKIVILGGSSKESDFSSLGDVISRSSSIKAVIGIGKEWSRINAEIKNQKSKIKIIVGCKNMHEVVQKCAEIGEIGDVVLLSPACASFDMFKNYKERGDKFKEEVFNLKN